MPVVFLFSAVDTFLDFLGTYEATFSRVWKKWVYLSLSTKKITGFLILGEIFFSVSQKRII